MESWFEVCLEKPLGKRNVGHKSRYAKRLFNFFRFFFGAWRRMVTARRRRMRFQAGCS
jgi:hypothetical protein